MKAVMGSDPRPNCLILDEIDGAPAASIDLLLKFIQGKLIPKGKKDKMNTDKSSNICHRPIICICNENGKEGNIEFRNKKLKKIILF